MRRRRSVPMAYDSIPRCGPSPEDGARSMPMPPAAQAQARPRSRRALVGLAISIPLAVVCARWTRRAASMASTAPTVFAARVEGAATEELDWRLVTNGSLSAVQLGSFLDVLAEARSAPRPACDPLVRAASTHRGALSPHRYVVVASRARPHRIGGLDASRMRSRRARSPLRRPPASRHSPFSSLTRGARLLRSRANVGRARRSRTRSSAS